MVKILSSGEIVSDDDPRAQSNIPSPSQQQPTPSTSAPPPQQQPRFDRNAPPLRIQTDGSPLGFTVIIFGLPFPAVQIIGCALLMMMFGVQGLFMASILWWYISSRPGGAGGGAPLQQRTAPNQAAAAAFMRDINYMQQGGTGGGARGEDTSGSVPQKRNDPWSNKGKAYKLG